MPAVCAAFGCGNSYYKGSKMHQFPRDAARRAEWERRIRTKGNYNSGTSAACLCEAHFTADAYESHRKDGLRKLKPNAVPKTGRLVDCEGEAVSIATGVPADHDYYVNVDLIQPTAQNIPTPGIIPSSPKMPKPSVSESTHRLGTSLPIHPLQPTSQNFPIPGIIPRTPEMPKSSMSEVTHILPDQLAAIIPEPQSRGSSLPVQNSPLMAYEIWPDVFLQDILKSKPTTNCVFVTKSTPICTSKIPMRAKPVSRTVTPTQRSTSRILLPKPSSSVSDGSAKGTLFQVPKLPKSSTGGSQQPILVISDPNTTISNSTLLLKNDILERKVEELEEKNRKILTKLKMAQNEVRNLNSTLNVLTSNLKYFLKPDQIKYLTKNGKQKGTKWSKATIKRADSLWGTAGTSGYEELLRQKYPLPSLRTLRRIESATNNTTVVHESITSIDCDEDVEEVVCDMN